MPSERAAADAHASAAKSGDVAAIAEKYRDLRAFLTFDHVLSECRVKHDFWFAKTKPFLAENPTPSKYDFRLNTLKQQDADLLDEAEFRPYRNKDLKTFVDRLFADEKIDPQLLRANALQLSANTSNVLCQLKKRVEEAFAGDGDASD